jgi:peptidoglycan/xylan/chitin deacetylase (PgdA/CDA1 family)
MPEGGAAAVPILLYHRVLPEDEIEDAYDLGAQEFARHLAYLCDSGYRSTTFEDVLAGGGSDGKRVVLSFDDAHLCNYTVTMPLLTRHGFSGTFFIPTGFIARDAGQVTMTQLRDMQHCGMEIHSHSHSHPFLNQLARRALLDELGTSKAILEEHLGKKVDVLACPGGRYNRLVLEVAAEAGYSGVCTSRPGYGRRARVGAVDVFDRWLIQSCTAHAEFVSILEMRSALLLRKRLAHAAKAAAKSALGHTLYHAIWRRLSR